MMAQLFLSDFILLMLAGLPLLMLIDVLTAWIAAGIRGEVSSKVNSKGFGKKALILVVLAAFAGADLAVIAGLDHFGMETLAFAGVKFGDIPLFTLVVLVWLSTGELTSILENLDKAGVVLPRWISRLLSNVRNKMDNYDGKD